MNFNIKRPQIMINSIQSHLPQMIKPDMCIYIGNKMLAVRRKQTNLRRFLLRLDGIIGAY